jgi:(2Fe-2S) ferredoxin
MIPLFCVYTEIIWYKAAKVAASTAAKAASTSAKAYS